MLRHRGVVVMLLHLVCWGREGGPGGQGRR